MKSIKINNKLSFSQNLPPLVIAEISCNHSGSKKSLIKHIEIANKYGADLVKIQTYEASDITSPKKNKTLKIKKGLWKNKFYWDLYKKAQTPYSWHKDAFSFARKKGITLFSTPFSIKAVNFLENLKVSLYKISSFEITDLNLIDRIGKTKKPVIISTGMSSMREIKNAINCIKKYHSKIVVLHCVSGYPTPEKDAHLERINILKKELPGILIGLSDHTNNIKTSVASSLLGVVAIEKHFMISNKVKSEDKKFSILPTDLRLLKSETQKYFEFLGKKNLSIKKSEKDSLKFRRSIYAFKDLKKGKKITAKNICCLRPKIGIGSEFFFKIIGKKLKRNKKSYDPIRFSDLR